LDRRLIARRRRQCCAPLGREAKRAQALPFAQLIGKLFDAAAQLATDLKLDRGRKAPGLHIGTSAFTAAGWEGSFHPAGMKPAECLSYYATKFDTVRVDSTFYRTPSVSTVNGWYEKTPPDFIFAAKVPQVVTHEKALMNREREFDEFVDRMDLLDEEATPKEETSSAVPKKVAEKAVAVLAHELRPLAGTVKKAVKKAVKEAVQDSEA
jgi:Protein of unknown function DUF72